MLDVRFAAKCAVLHTQLHVRADKLISLEGLDCDQLSQHLDPFPDRGLVPNGIHATEDGILTDDLDALSGHRPLWESRDLHDLLESSQVARQPRSVGRPGPLRRGRGFLGLWLGSRWCLLLLRRALLLHGFDTRLRHGTKLLLDVL